MKKNSINNEIINANLLLSYYTDWKHLKFW